MLAMIGLLLPEWWLVDWTIAKRRRLTAGSKRQRETNASSAFEIRDPTLGTAAGSTVVEYRGHWQRC